LSASVLPLKHVSKPLVLEVDVPMVGELAELLHLFGLSDLQHALGVDDCHDLVGTQVAVLEGERTPSMARVGRLHQEGDFGVAHSVAVLL